MSFTVEGPGSDSDEPGAADAADDAASSTITRRANAFMIDLVLTFAITALIAVTAFFTTAVALVPVVVIAVPGVAIVANTIAVWRIGHTLGQWMLGLSVVESTTGGRIGLGRSVIRALIITSPVIASVVIEFALSAGGGRGWSPAGFVWFVTAVWFFMLVIASAFRTGALHDVATRSTVIHGQPRP